MFRAKENCYACSHTTERTSRWSLLLWVGVARAELASGLWFPQIQNPLTPMRLAKSGKVWTLSANISCCHRISVRRHSARLRFDHRRGGCDFSKSLWYVRPYANAALQCVYTEYHRTRHEHRDAIEKHKTLPGRWRGMGANGNSVAGKSS